MINIKTNLSVFEYIMLVNSIVEDFFDGEGEYTPHLGKLNALRLFYNQCVIESDLEVPHDFADATLIDTLAENKEIVTAYNEALKGDGTVCLNFANAYADALEIVNTKKSSLSNAVNVVKKAISNIVDMINPVLSGDNIDKIKEIADGFANGDISADKIVEAFGNSQRMQDVVKGE